MLHSNDLDFSFSGLKTAVRYALDDKPKVNDDEKAALAKEFEASVSEVLNKKISSAIDKYYINTLIVGGGVSANRFLKESLLAHLKKTNPHITCFFPDIKLATDNSIMIALAGHANLKNILTGSEIQNIKAVGNQSLHTKNNHDKTSPN